MVWQKLGSETLGSAASSITVSSLDTSSSSFLKLDIFAPTGGNSAMLQYLRLNGDTGTSYAWNYERNADDGNDSGSGTSDGIIIGATDMSYGVYTTVYISNNILNSEKLVLGVSVADESATSPSGAVNQTHFVGKWVGTAVIDEVTVRSSTGGASDFPSGTEVTVYGSDESLVNPSLPNGTIFNETDTYKYFMFDGTDTWNQMVSS